ncbi:MAG: hypothetical protein ABIJ61_07685 [bacterium]
MVYNARSCLCNSSGDYGCTVDSLLWNDLGCSGIGTDFVAIPSDSFQLSTTSGDSVLIDLTEDFRWFCDHRDSVFGWVLWRNESTALGTYRGIISSNATFSGGIYRPRLEIFYSTPRAALVLNDISSAATIGVDSLLFLAMRDDLDYEVSYLTDADVVSLGSTYFDTAYDVVVWAGEEVAGPSPSSNADTIAASRVGWLSLYRWNYDENDLGIGENRLLDNRQLVVNRDHWITRVLQDTLFMFLDNSVSAAYTVAPDSAHGVVPLIVDEDNAGDTAYVTMCAADSGVTVFNGHITNGRRVFLGLFHQGSVVRDSCQFYTIFNRAVAWAASDTNNYHLTHDACFSGWLEVEDAWAENSSGADSLESYGGWASLYTGFDFDEKVAFMKVRNDALRRKLPYDTVEIERFDIRMKVNAVVNDPEDSLWQQTNGLRLLKSLWKCGRELGSTASDYVSWTYRCRTDTDSFPWFAGGAHGLGSDVVDTVLDSLRQNRDNTGSGSVLLWRIPPDYAQLMIADTLNNHGWVWHNLYNNQQNQLNDAEIIYHSADVGDPRNKPLITIRLRSCGVGEQLLARRRAGIIGNGLLGGR